MNNVRIRLCVKLQDRHGVSVKDHREKALIRDGGKRRSVRLDRRIVRESEYTGKGKGPMLYPILNQYNRDAFGGRWKRG